MPKGKRKQKTEPVVVQIMPSDFQRAVQDASRLKRQAADANGFAARGQNAFTKRTGYPGKVFNWIRSLNDMEDGVRREHIIREFLFGCEMMGWLAQGDLFSDVQSKVDELRKQEAEAPAPAGNGGLPLDEAQKAFEAAREANPPEVIGVDEAAGAEEFDGNDEAERKARIAEQDDAVDAAANGGMPETPEHLDRRRKSKREPADAIDEIAGATTH